MPAFAHTILPDPDQLCLLGLSADGSTITARVAPRATTADCPRCAQPSAHRHSHYDRRVSDLPWHGVTLRLELHVRRFFCDNPACARQIFTERLPGVVAPYARRTSRLEAWFTAVGFAVGGEAGARLLRALGLSSSPPTLLRRRRAGVRPTAPTPRVLSVDEWSFRRGHHYGTLLVDLERRQPVDLLSDRTAATLADWLQAHPGVEILSRDRSGSYAEAARQGAPHAVQVADRFHLFKNVGEAIERIFQRHVTLIQTIAVPPRAATPAATPAAPPAPATTAAPRPYREAARVRTQAKMAARHAAIGALAAKGMSQQGIAQAVGVHRHTVQRYLAADTAPQRPQRIRPASILRPYEAYLLERWRQGERNGLGLWREMVAQGYPGTRSNVARFMAHLRHQEHEGIATPTLPPAPGLTPRRALGLLLARDEMRPQEHEEAVSQLRKVHPELDSAVTLLHRFAGMIRARDAAALDAWFADAVQSGLPELTAFVTKLRQDEEAVRAGLTLPWSQGQMEGQVNRLNQRSSFRRPHRGRLLISECVWQYARPSRGKVARWS